MLNFSFSSVLMAVFSCNILLVFLALILRSQYITWGIGLKLIKAFAVITILRFLFPFELPITSNLYFPERFSRFIAIIFYTKFQVIGVTFSIWNVLELIWGAGFLFFFVRHVRLRICFYRLIHYCGTDITNEEPYLSIVSELCKHKKVHVVTLAGIQTPMACQYLSYYILIPKHLDLSEQNLRFVLQHECSHIQHHDLWTKAVIQWIYMVYWWNPFCYFLRSKTDFLFELQADRSITSEGFQQTCDYIHCLIDVCEQMEQIEKRYSTGSENGIAFRTEIPSVFEQRMQMLVSPNVRSKRLFRTILIPILAFYLFSFAFIFEAASVDPQTEKISNSMSSDTTYMIRQKDGSYDVYYNGIFVENTNSLDYYPDPCTIYDNEKEAIDHEEKK